MNSPVPHNLQDESQNESISQEIFAEGEEYFLSLINSPLFYEYAGVARQLNEDELRALYGMMIISLRQAKANFEEQHGTTVDLMSCHPREAQNQPVASAIIPVPLPSNTDR